jgi:RNA 2',3'-cyclic 3'-phosphodiesterase
VSDLPPKIRAFVAIRVCANVERAIDDLTAGLRGPNDGIKWVSTTNLHLTLKFLGPAVAIEKIDRLKPELEKIAAETKSFEIEASGIGGFPDLKHPHVLWVGLRSEQLRILAERVDEAAARCGFEREQRAFNGHLTIGRLKRPRLHSETRTRIEAVMTRDFGVSTIREMTLYRSITAPASPIYEVLRNFEFIA